MSEQQIEKALIAQPTVAYPRSTVMGKRYEMKIDLENTGQWPDDSIEETAIYCMVSCSLFSCVPVDAPAIVLHRFGGSYGPCRFVLTPKAVGDARIVITLVNRYGVPIHTMRLPNIPIAEA